MDLAGHGLEEGRQEFVGPEDEDFLDDDFTDDEADWMPHPNPISQGTPLSASSTGGLAELIALGAMDSYLHW
jgi:hypothetical protein